jgi:hypothetical protein
MLPGSPYVCGEGAGAVTVFEAFAYYRDGAPDPGTIIRFVQRPEESPLPLPGLEAVAAAFDGTSVRAYADHWVSNVFDRQRFLDTLNDTLGFVPKVDFNAGVVAAGEAQIESTVTGNSASFATADHAVALAYQGQVFLPINNALSEVGHVHWFLKELGQGIQHVASRVASLPAVVQRANDFRAVTGCGVSFLNIPRTYYGLLDLPLLERGADGHGLEPAQAFRALAALRAAGLVDAEGVASLACADGPPGAVPPLLAAALDGMNADDVLKAAAAARRSIYRNLHAMLTDRIDEETYLTIVRNKILIDVQGADVLMQIFTSNVLQRKAGDEAPFLEFIQRLCAAPNGEALRSGCGGFGIRNFLTLFLSIEVSKAMVDKRAAAAAGDDAGAAFHGNRVALFTQQLVEANPILTEISDCMTLEGSALDRGDTQAAAAITARKAAANNALQACSAKFNGLMKQLREGRAGV